MPRCLWELESIELNPKGAVAALSRAREAGGHSGTPLRAPAIKAKCVGLVTPSTADSPCPGILMAGLHKRITLKAAKASPLETLRELEEKSGKTRRSGLRRGEKSKEPGVKEPRKEFQEKESDLQGQTLHPRRGLEKEPEGTGSPDLKEGQSGRQGWGGRDKCRAAGLLQTCPHNY